MESVSTKDRTDQARFTDRGTTITITDVTDQDIKLSNFLFLSPPKGPVINMKHMQLLADKPGKIFRKGVFVCKHKYLYYGYNVVSNDTELVNRDRCNVDEDKFCTLLMKSWGSILSENWKLFVAIVKAKPYSKEVLNSCDMSDKAIQKLAQRELPPIFILDSDPKLKKQKQLAQELGVMDRLVVSPPHLFEAFTPICDSFEIYQKKLLSQSADKSLDKWRKEEPAVNFLFNNLPQEISLNLFKFKECHLPIASAMSNDYCVLNTSYLNRKHLHEEAPCPTAQFGDCHCVLRRLIGIIEDNFQTDNLDVTIMHLLMTEQLNEKDKEIDELKAELAKYKQEAKSGKDDEPAKKKRSSDVGWIIDDHIEVSQPEGMTVTGRLKRVFRDGSTNLFMIEDTKEE
jgi:hypothetical protein